MIPIEPHDLRCETCAFRPQSKDWREPKYLLWKNCPLKEETTHHKLKELVVLPDGYEEITQLIGCAVHSNVDTIKRKVEK